MDFSKQYILMCEKATEIQRPIGEGDYAYCRGEASLITYQADYDSLAMEHKLINTSDKIIWLPRQDQLQEMLENKFSNRTKFVLLSIFKDWVVEELNYHQKHTPERALLIAGASMEMLWLMYAMNENFGKGWINEEWQEDTERFT